MKKLFCLLFGHKLGWEIYDSRRCKRIGCDHVEPAVERPPCPSMRMEKVWVDLITRMRTIELENDIEDGHSIADDILIECLRLLSKGTDQEQDISIICDLFEQMERWYS